MNKSNYFKKKSLIMLYNKWFERVKFLVGSDFHSLWISNYTSEEDKRNSQHINSPFASALSLSGWTAHESLPAASAVWIFLISQLRQNPSWWISSSRTFCFSPSLSLFHSTCVLPALERSARIEEESDREMERGRERDDNVLKEEC